MYLTGDTIDLWSNFDFGIYWFIQLKQISHLFLDTSLQENTNMDTRSILDPY